MTSKAPANLIPLTDWLIRTGIEGASDDVLVGGACEALRDAGVPIDRVFVGQQVLHPVIEARVVTWTPETGVAIENFSRESTDAVREGWSESPLSRLEDQRLSDMRFRLSDGEGLADFKLLRTVRDAGGTDYFCQRAMLPADERRMMDASFYLTWATKHPDGFSDGHLAMLRGIVGYLTYALRNAHADDAAELLLKTYLGAGPSQRILRGRIGRGETEEIEAVIWFSDLQGFTRLTDELTPVEAVALLNDYDEIIVDAVEGQGGEVLKFIGDGILGIFPIAEASDDRPACARALTAVLDVIAKVEAVNPARRAAGLPETSPYIGLNVGKVVYGNVGGRERLDFTVVGPAVNEASRIAALCRSVDQPAVMSQAFAGMAGEHGAPLVGLGRFALRGIARPQNLYTIDWTALPGGNVEEKDEAAS